MLCVDEFSELFHKLNAPPRAAMYILCPVARQTPKHRPNSFCSIHPHTSALFPFLSVSFLLIHSSPILFSLYAEKGRTNPFLIIVSLNYSLSEVENRATSDS